MAIDTVVECQSVGDTNSAREMKREFKLQVEVAQVQQRLGDRIAGGRRCMQGGCMECAMWVQRGCGYREGAGSVGMTQNVGGAGSARSGGKVQRVTGI